MKELIEYLARGLASRPDEIVVEAEERADQIVFHLECAEQDKGRIIGREGRVVNAMRSLLHVASIRAGVRTSLNIE